MVKRLARGNPKRMYKYTFGISINELATRLRKQTTSKKYSFMDRRFAIVIGINDYVLKPLDFCVNDANSIAEILENKCGFENKDIYKITSDDSAPIKDITGQFENALTMIGQELKAEKDSIFFFFAGHGKYQFDNSGLKFHDSFMEISTVFDKINDLQPKYQCYVIDACESGGKVLTRGENVDNDIINKYLSKSKGILFMYASTEEESAKELSDIKHGLFSYHFIKAINDTENYDKDGILTPNRIHDYISRETSLESDFKQTPVIENRTIGYYPFAFKDKPQTKKETIRKEEIEKKVETNIINKEYFPVVPNEIRVSVFEEIKPKVESIFSSWIINLELNDYEIATGSDLSIFEKKVQDKLLDKIVEKSREEKVEAVNLLFSTEREEIKPNPLLVGMGMIEALLNKNKPKYHYYNRIIWGDDRIISLSASFKSKNIFQSTCGTIIVLYQSVYGIGLAKASFYLDYTGYSDTQINGPYVNISAFKYHAKTIENILRDISLDLEYFKGMINDWNDKRKQSISEFNNKAK
jgi:hypothetical protein